MIDYYTKVGGGGGGGGLKCLTFTVSITPYRKNGTKGA